MSNHSNRHFRAYERRIIYVLLSALLTIQILAYQISSEANRRIAENNLHAQLQTGAQVFYQLLELRQRQLLQTAEVLAADYGLKEATATRERPTIESMLLNHSKRIQADIALLSDLDQQLIASVPMHVQASDIAPLLKAPASANAEDRTAPIETLETREGALYQLIRSTVHMPRPQAELTLGFAIDDHFAQDLRRVTDAEFIFASRAADGRWRLHGSTLDGNAEQLLAPPQTLTTQSSWTLHGRHDAYLMLSLPLQREATATRGEVMVIMGKSLNQAMAPYQQIEQTQRYLILASLLLSALAVLFITRRMVAPLNAMAHQDPLTGLANRRFFDLCLRRAMADLGRKRVPFCVMMIDLDQFKQINDRYGHAAGDEVLKVTAQRLRALLRKTDTPARLGGDEFAALLPGAERGTAEHIAEKIQRVLSEPILFAQQPLQVGISIGLAIAPQDGDSPSELLRAADEAMYAAKPGALNGDSLV